MGKKISAIVLVLIVICLFFFYWLGGFSYIRALTLVYRNPLNIRQDIKTALFASDNDNTYGGIFASVLGNRVWIWGQGGIRSFKTDENSVYVYNDACGGEIRKKILERQRTLPIDRAYQSIDDWNAYMKSGDYVVVQISIKEQGGEVGNLREAHAYNYWPFLRGDINTLCAK